MADPASAVALDYERAPLVSRQEIALAVDPGHGFALYPVPVYLLIGRERRPRVVVTASVHGDEFEGVRAVGHLLRDLDPAVMHGTVALVPVAHPPAHAARTRVSPLDGKDLNRTFPGDPVGGPTERLAAALLNKVVAGADMLIDLHSGGTRTRFAPMVGFRSDPPAVAAASHAAASIFGLPWLWWMGGDRSVFSYEAARRGVPSLGVEAGGRGGLRPADVRVMREGVGAVLRHLGVLPGGVDVPSAPLPVYAGDWTLSPATGLWEPRVALGETVEAGQPLADILAPDGTLVTTLTAPHAGFVGALRTFCAVDAGDWAVTVMAPRAYPNKERRARYE